MSKINIHILIIFLLLLITFCFTGCKKNHYFNLGIFNKSPEKIFDVKIELMPSNIFYEEKILSQNTCHWFGNFILQIPSELRISFKGKNNKKYRFSKKLKSDICWLKIIIDKSKGDIQEYKVFLIQKPNLKK